MSPMSQRRDRWPAGLLSPGGRTCGNASLAGDDVVCSCTRSLARPNRLPASGERKKTSGRTCGFSLPEVLVALAVAAMMAAVLTRHVAGTRLSAAQVGERVEVWTISQSMLDGLPTTLSPGASSGQIGAYRWHREIAPIASDAVARVEAPLFLSGAFCGNPPDRSRSAREPNQSIWRPLDRLFRNWAPQSRFQSRPFHDQRLNPPRQPRGPHAKC